MAASSRSKRIGILTGGGDAPGINAVIRGCVLRAETLDMEMVGIRRSWLGLKDGDIMMLDSHVTHRWLIRGGTELRTRRFNPFDEDEQQLILDGFAALDLDGLIAIGGEGTLATCHGLHELGMPIVGVPKTIDNDILGTDQTFGFDTAVQAACDAIDRLHTTAAAHGRVLIVEVMGRYAGWIAAYAGVAGEADLVLVPEHPVKLADVIAWAKSLKEHGQEYAILVVAEGALILRDDGVPLVRGEFTAGGYEKLGGVSVQLARELMAAGVDSRTTILGHTQRGGSPSAFDRILSLRYGGRATELLADGVSGVMVSLVDNRMTTVPLSEVASGRRNFDPDRFDLAWMLARLPLAG
ncbi:MAG: 6-phosphofructokinase [Alphaproteobacteria bacterium]